MNVEKRHIVYQKVKNYIKHRKRDLRFPFHPSYERSTDFRTDLKNLKEYDYDLGEVRQSEVWCERYDNEEPIKVVTLKPHQFWNFLYSNDWDNCSSFRVCEGELLDILLESLYFLQRAGSLMFYRMARFDECKFRCPETANKLVNCTSPAYQTRPVKITFTFFGNSNKHWGSMSSQGHANTSDTALSVPFIITCEESDDSQESDLSGRDAPLKPHFSSIRDRMDRCQSDETGSPSKSRLFASNRLLNSAVQSDLSVNTMASTIKPLMAFQFKVNRLKNKEATAKASISTGSRKGSIHFRPSHESMEDEELLIEDDRYFREVDQYGRDAPFDLWNTESNRCAVSPKMVDPCEHVAEDDQNVDLLKEFMHFGISRRREFLLTANTSDGQSRHVFSRSPAQGRVMKSCLLNQNTSPTIRGESAKMHLDRSALVYGHCGERSPTTARNLDLSPEEIVLPLTPTPPPAEEMPKENVVEQIKVAQVGICKPKSPMRAKVKKVTYSARLRKKDHVPKYEKGKINVKQLCLSHSIDQLRVFNAKQKDLFKALDFDEELKRKYISKKLNSELARIYKEKGFVPQRTEEKQIHLFTQDPSITKNMKNVEEFRNEERPKANGKKCDPLFPSLDRADFESRLQVAANEFLIRKEHIMCNSGMRSITSVTINRIIPCQYGEESIHEEKL